jgi:hypothetical protein
MLLRQHQGRGQIVSNEELVDLTETMTLYKLGPVEVCS